MTTDTPAYGVTAADALLAPMTIPRRGTGARDVRIEIDYCGVCHTDIHVAHNDWGRTTYPVVPGHEIVGRVTAVGDAVTEHAVGDVVAVGCFVDSCRECEACQEREEQFCPTVRATYNRPDPHLPGHQTYGGYSTDIVVDADFVLRVPQGLDPAGTAPLLCAGITTYSPLAHWKVGPGQKVGVIGLGGLGHMGVKFAHALGAEVVMITTSEAKGADARRLGADSVLLSRDADAMAAAVGTFDFLLNTIPVSHDTGPYLALLKRDCTMVIVGAIDPVDVHAGMLMRGRKRLAASLIGGLRETQEMLDFCGAHGITSDVEVIGMHDINTAWERVVAGDVRYRFVIDLGSMR